MLYSRQRRIVLLKAATLFSTLTDTFEEILAAQLKVVRNSFPFSIITELYERLTRL